VPRANTRIVSHQDIHDLFERNGIWGQIESGQLTTEVLPRTSPSTSYINATSQMLKHRDASGLHVCTTHRIVDNVTQEALHWDEADIRLDGLVYVKAHEQH
jgi:hypothetical protein